MIKCLTNKYSTHFLLAIPSLKKRDDGWDQGCLGYRVSTLMRGDPFSYSTHLAAPTPSICPAALEALQFTKGGGGGLGDCSKRQSPSTNLGSHENHHFLSKTWTES